MSGAGYEDFRVFYRQEYAPLVKWLVVQGACCAADAEDAAQVAFTAVWCRWPTVGNRHGYLYRVARNELGHLHRLEQAQEMAARQVGELTRRQTAEEVPDRLQAAVVLEQLLTLPPAQRMVLACHYDADAQLARLAERPDVTVRSNLRHARANLRKLAAGPAPQLHERVMRQAYAEMRSGNFSPPGARPVISQSWARSVQYLADPGPGPVVAPLSADDLAFRRGISALRAAAPTICARQADATGLMMVITDADGWLLWRAGKREDLARGDRDGHVVGACLSERSMGTSGVSLALAARHPVLVNGAEHYAPALHDLACAAAPVYHPRDGRLLGILNLTAPPRVANRALLQHIDEIARQIRRQLAEPGQ